MWNICFSVSASCQRPCDSYHMQLLGQRGHWPTLPLRKLCLIGKLANYKLSLISFVIVITCSCCGRGGIGPLCHNSHNYSRASKNGLRFCNTWPHLKGFSLEGLHFQRTSLTARMIALIAFVVLLSSVSALVFFQMRSSSAWMVALIAFEQLFSWIDPDVIFEITISWKGEATLWAAEELFSDVLELVSFQMSSWSAFIVALITMKRFFTWMGTDD